MATVNRVLQPHPGELPWPHLATGNRLGLRSLISPREVEGGSLYRRMKGCTTVPFRQLAEHGLSDTSLMAHLDDPVACSAIFQSQKYLEVRPFCPVRRALRCLTGSASDTPGR